MQSVRGSCLVGALSKLPHFDPSGCPDIDSQTHRQEDDLKNILLFLQERKYGILVGRIPQKEACLRTEQDCPVVVYGFSHTLTLGLITTVKCNELVWLLIFVKTCKQVMSSVSPVYKERIIAFVLLRFDTVYKLN
jgi:hypothetical protein